MGFNVLILGGGGREHALAAALRCSPRLAELYCAPGNPGISRISRPASVEPADFAAVARFCALHRIDLVVPGSETLLAAGVADALAPVPVFGPGRAAARLEASKIGATAFRQRHGVPAPRAVVPDTPAAALDLAVRMVREHGGVAIKADGLCAGKGVLLARTPDEARQAVARLMLEREQGAAGERVVLEELLEGEELSVLAFCDGQRLEPLLPARDAKRLLEADAGPNTGGMGAFAPAPPDVRMQPIQEQVRERILAPTLAGLRAEGIDYRGLLYVGLMLTPGGPKVLEYNVRFGDPETQALLPLLESDLLEWMLGACAGRLPAEPLRWRRGASVCVVLASEGYPGRPKLDRRIEGVDAAEALGARVFHAGTRAGSDGSLFTAGGRVLGVVGLGADLAAAADLAHAAADRVRFDGQQRRRDIGRPRENRAD